MKQERHLKKQVLFKSIKELYNNTSFSFLTNFKNFHKKR